MNTHQDIRVLSYSLSLCPSPSDLSVVAAGERVGGSGTGEQRGQPAPGEPGPHPGSPRRGDRQAQQVAHVQPG